MTLQQKAIRVLREAASTIEARARQYNGKGDMFDEIAASAGCDVSVIFAVLRGTKIARLNANPEHYDSLVDLIAYTALEQCKKWERATKL